MSLKGNTVAEQIWNFCKGKGLTDYGTAGLMGNLYAESGLNSMNLQNSSEKKLNLSDAAYTQSVDSDSYQNFVRDSAGYGLAQWTYWNRKQNLLNFVRVRGTSIGDLESQLEFLFKELETGYKSVLDVLVSVDSIEKASNEVLLRFEKPKNQSSTVQNKRIEYSQKYFDEFTQKQGGSTMSVIVGSARINEKGTVNGGAGGDQTGSEVSTQAWYLHSKGWVVIRPKSSDDAEKIAKNMQAICDNDNIGYCQSHRGTLTTAAKPYGYDASKVTKKVEVDCSEAARNCVLYAGISVNSFTTANEATVLNATGKFDILKGDEYCKSDELLKRGDILVTKTKGHTVVVLTNGSKVSAPAAKPTTTTSNPGKVAAAQKKNNSLAGTYTTTAALRLRTKPGTTNTDTIILVIPQGDKVQNYGYYTPVSGTNWLYVSYKGHTGFCSADYLKKC